MIMNPQPASLLFTLLLCLSQFARPTFAGRHNYAEALSKSILFFEGQRSGYLPRNQRVSWRSNSALHDGKLQGIDLVGGYYDAGDNVKFGLPMAFTVTMLSWSVMEYRRQMAAHGELRHAMEAIKWGTDYFIKAHPQPYVLYGEVGDGDTDHYCWQRPEDMTSSRFAYRIDANHPGSDLAGETAAAMAAASLVFRHSDPHYANELLIHAKQLFEFADTYRGKYDNSITVARKYYQSVSGYADELLWAAAWLYRATKRSYYLDYLANNGDAHGGTTWSMTQFGWDVKYAGVQVLVSKFLMEGASPKHVEVFRRYQGNAEKFMCSCLGKSGGGGRNVRRTPGGLLYLQHWNNLQFVTSASFLLSIYSDLLSSSRSSLRCSSGAVAHPAELLLFAKSQVDYILGDNPRGTSYMVGYGMNYPRHVHHRASSIVSIKVDPTFVSCRGGYSTWFSKKSGNPNLLVGAVVGGPDAYDNFIDDRSNYQQTEPATYNNAPLLGVLARLSGGINGAPTYQHLLPGPVPISVTQVVTKSWIAKGRAYHRYWAFIHNRTRRPAKNIRLSIGKLYGPIWGLTKVGSVYRLKTRSQTLRPGQVVHIAYIQAAGPAIIKVSSYQPA
ncbi:endoglucanase 6-like isoform X1 [Nymphaea colorata]|uniref:endoglucanase 6-like isoform X1 n=1 Tax=Nymphaea colorata TaxID=210225 RepID=UPI00129E9C8A|nr:endoglucanase 6-like isoform X1 [Nymphaea colorata]